MAKLPAPHPKKGFLIISAITSLYISNLCDWTKLVKLNVESLFNKLNGIINSKILKKLINKEFFARYRINKKSKKIKK